MLKLQMLPAGSGDCLWLEYGTPGATHVVIIDGGVRETVTALRQRIEDACRERGSPKLDVELLVVTHIDNDHILGILELLKTAQHLLNVRDVWFNGRPQLIGLPKPDKAVSSGAGSRGGRRSSRPADMLGGDDGLENQLEESEEFDELARLPSPSDLLGPQQGDELSQLLIARRQPWNQHPCWNGKVVMVPDSGDLPAASLDGGLKLTLLGPTFPRLYKLCAAWPDVLGGRDEPSSETTAPADLLGRRDTWPPVWKDEEHRDPSAANGSSIMLLAEFDGLALLLAGDGHALDLAAALERVSLERGVPGAALTLDAFKLPHHASEKNLSRAVLERVDCSRYLISTDGSTHGHPDHQALLRILRYSRSTPELLFNYAANTTQPWRDSKSDVLNAGFQDYETTFPINPQDGLILELD